MSEQTTTVFAEAGKQEILITREFDAPRELVFKVCMDPKLIPEWWGPRYLSTEVDKMDVKPGGEWRFINRDAEGNAYAFHGVPSGSASFATMLALTVSSSAWSTPFSRRNPFRSGIHWR